MSRKLGTAINNNYDNTQMALTSRLASANDAEADFFSGDINKLVELVNPEIQLAAITQVGGLEDALADKLDLAGGTMTGDLILNVDPTVDLGAATKQYVDNHSSNVGVLTGYEGIGGASDVTLTNPMKAYYEVAFSGPDLKVILPDMMAQPLGQMPIFKNVDQDCDIVAQNGSSVVTVLSTGKQVTLTLKNNSTANGLFEIEELGSVVSLNQSEVALNADNLSNLANSATARTNLGLGTAAVKSVSDDTESSVASVSGATVVDDLAAFDDTAGTVKNSGLNSAILIMPHENFIIGGDFSTNPWQRQITFANPADGSYTADNWFWSAAGAGVVTVKRTTDAPSEAVAGFVSTNCLEVDVTTADASISASDFYTIAYRVEGYDFAKFAQQYFTLSFNVKSNLTGISCVSFHNSGGSRDYLAEYTINAADTWENKTITVLPTPDVSGFEYNTQPGLYIYFMIAAGSDNFGTADAWLENNGSCTSNQINLMSSTANYLRIQGLKLERGTIRTPFNFTPVSETLLRCQRYYEKSYETGVYPGTNTTTGSSKQINGTTSTEIFLLDTRFRQTKSNNPTVTWYSVGGAINEVRNQTAGTNPSVSVTTGTSENSTGWPTISSAPAANALILAQWTAEVF